MCWVACAVSPRSRVVLMMFRAFPLARRRIAEAVAIAQDSRPPGRDRSGGLRAWLAPVDVTGALDESVQSFEQSAAAYKGIGDIRGGEGRPLASTGSSTSRADFASAAQLAADMVRVGQDAGDPHVASWGLNGLGLLALTAGPLDEAASHLSTVRDMSRQHLVLSHASQRRGPPGEVSLATRAAARGRSILQRGHRPHRGQEPARCVVGRPAQCLRRALPGQGRPPFGRAAASSPPRRQPGVREGAALHSGCRHVAARDAASARDAGVALRRYHSPRTSAGRRASRPQRSLRLTVERARTLLEMGDRRRRRRLRGRGDRRVRCRLAQGLIWLSACTHEPGWSAESGADVRSTLQRYDQAIAALDEVKAEYALGVACRQRAQLHKQLGRLDQARADLAQARSCFAAVGAAVEQADVEQEAIALGERDGSA